MFNSSPRTVRKNERTRILFRFSSSMDMTYRFRADPAHPGDQVSGIVEIRGSNWLFPKGPRTQPLEIENVVHKGVWDTIYSVYVIPACDVLIARRGSSPGRFATTAILAAVIVAAAVLAVVFGLFL